MPKGELTEVYNYFRSKPLHKSQARVGGMDSIRINTWDNIFYPRSEKEQTRQSKLTEFGMQFTEGETNE